LGCAGTSIVAAADQRQNRRNQECRNNGSSNASTNTNHRYFLFIGGSSTHMAQKPVGFALAAFLITLIFILVSYDALAAVCASDTSADS